jgi:UDP-2,3-diacylglucosamine hydrolase
MLLYYPNRLNRNIMPNIFFISDLHLCEAEPRATDIFLDFLQHQAREAEALYILGDLFEAWVGDDDHCAFNLKIITALRDATQSGLPIYFMRGNRDFLIGKQFMQQSGVRLLNDPTVINLYGVRTLLMHGDSLCTLDTQHQRTRRFTLNPFCQWLGLRLLSLNCRKRLGAWMRGKSRGHLRQIDEDIMDVYPPTVTKAMNDHQASRLIHGHTHRPAIHTLAAGERIVLGAWHEAGNALICDEQQNCYLQALPYNQF